MGGLVALMALCLFTGFCWLISGWIIRNKSNKYYGIKRAIVFLIPVLAPVYIQVVEYVLFQQACKEAVVYFPEKKLEAPDVLITDNSNKKNKGRYFDGMFKYIASPHYMNNKPIDITKSKEQFKDYIVYPYKSNALQNENREQVLDEMRYALVFSPGLIQEKWHSYKTAKYIYDFVEERKISEVILVHPESHRGLGGVFHARFKNCPNKASFDYGSNDIIKNTFIMENK